MSNLEVVERLRGGFVPRVLNVVEDLLTNHQEDGAQLGAC